MIGLSGCGVRGHDDGRVGVERGGGEVGVGHQRNMGSELIVTCCQMELIDGHGQY